MDTRSQQPQAPEAPVLSVAEQQHRYWARLRPIVPLLSDRELSLLALLVFWSGPKTVPGDRVLKSWRTIGPRIGSQRVGGRQSANRQALSAAASRLHALGLIERTGTDAVWRVIPEPSMAMIIGIADRGGGDPTTLSASPASLAAEDRAVPVWAGFPNFNARLWRREFAGAMSTRAAICRLSYELDFDGNWNGNTAAFAGLLGVGGQTARKRIGEINAAERDLELVEGLDNGQLTITVACRYQSPRTGDDISTELTKARDAIWYPELMDEIVARAGRLLKSGTVSEGRQLSGFYRPILDLQTEFNNPGLLKYALEQTLKNGILDGTKGQSSTTNWHRYTRKICQNNRHKFLRAADAGMEVVSGPISPVAGSDAAQGKTPGSGSGQVRQKTQQRSARRRQPQNHQQPSIRERELAVRELLSRAGSLNGTGRSEEARKILVEEIKPLIPSVVELFDGNTRYCRDALALAFKQGASDFVGVKPDEYALDFMPEWSPKSWPPA